MVSLRGAFEARPVPTLTRRRKRQATVAGGAIALWLVPWSGVLAATLPRTAKAYHWAAAWTGLDLAEAAAAGLTALLLSRDDGRAALSATALATLLTLDAWFDVCTSAPGGPFVLAIAEAACLELPLAAAAAFLAAKLLASPDTRPGPW